MPKTKAAPEIDDIKSLRPALSPEAQENQLIALAYKAVEKKLRDGTASSQEIVHFLKLGSTKERLEKEILAEQKKLIKAKTDNLESNQRIEQMYGEAMEAMKNYGAHNGGILDEWPENV